MAFDRIPLWRLTGFRCGVWRDSVVAFDGIPLWRLTGCTAGASPAEPSGRQSAAVAAAVPVAPPAARLEVRGESTAGAPPAEPSGRQSAAVAAAVPGAPPAEIAVMSAFPPLAFSLRDNSLGSERTL